MSLSSPKIAFDKRLLAVEELFRQRQYQPAARDVEALDESTFSEDPHQHGLYLALSAEADDFNGNYKRAVGKGLQAARLLADLPVNRRYGRVQLVLSKSYFAMGDLKNSEIRARDALAAFRRGSDAIGQIDPLNQLARISFVRSDHGAAVSFLEEALALVDGDRRRAAQLTGNLGRIRIHTGQWIEAEHELTEALEFSREHQLELSQAINLLSLGYLQIRRRHFIMAGRALDQALEIIARLGAKREKINYLEYAGELAFEKGDLYKAKSILSDAYQQGMLLAASSGLVSQSARRLAQVELDLDNVEEAMKYAQKALELAVSMGELEEIVNARRVIGQIFAARGSYADAIDYLHQALEAARQLGDPYDLARTLLAYADVRMEAGSDENEKTRAALDEAHRLFRKLKLDYWVAETDYRSGVLACRLGDLAQGFRKMSRAERAYGSIDDKPRLKQVHQFLNSLAEQAVALSVSQQNEFKVFGNVITPDEYSDLKSSRIEDILDLVARRTDARRAIIYSPDGPNARVLANYEIDEPSARIFADGFARMLGQEIAKKKPTLILDCRRDPFINDLFPNTPEPVASMIVVPFSAGDSAPCYLYLDRFSVDNTLNPFGQAALNFAVGFSDLIAFKWSELQKIKLAEDNERLKRQLREQSAFPNIITQSPQMRDMLDQVRQVVHANIAIAIEGETGCGKDLLARAIHYNSNRRDKRFISVNCAALPETLLESELFGHKRGAFTGADRDKPGLFEEADGGTFFLDEIADMPLSIQAKILRVLEAKEIVRLGETTPRKVDVRIVSATNKDLKVEMEARRFRNDLYYRLSAMTVRITPLRERKEDIPLLVTHFLTDTGKRPSPELMKILMAYEWPGNVRELENELKRLVLLSGDDDIIDDRFASPHMVSAMHEADDRVRQAMELSGDVEFTDQYTMYDYLSGFEKRFIMRALKEKDGVKKHAATVLGIPESTLRLKIKQYDIDLDNLDAVH